MDSFTLWRTLDGKPAPDVGGNSRVATDNAELVDSFTSDHASLQHIIAKADLEADLNPGTAFFVVCLETGHTPPGRIVAMAKRIRLDAGLWS